MRRVTSRAFLYGGAGFVLFVVYCWLRRLGQDLSWDESLNLEIYARHPFAALGLYREPNNHLLDSFFKSLFYVVPDLKTPFFYRLPNFVYIAFYLYAAWHLCRGLWRRGSPFAAGVLGTMLISASLIQWQMYNMRGYLAGIVVGLWGLRYLINKCNLLSGEVTMLDRRGTWGVAIFLTLLHAAVPTNAPLGAVQVLLVAIFFMSGAPLWKRAFTLWLKVAVLTILVYLPILISVGLGISRPKNLGGGLGKPVDNTSIWVTDLQSLAPEGTPVEFLHVFLGAIALLFVTRMKSRVALFGFSLAVLSFWSGESTRYLLNAPHRVLGPMGVPILVGTGLVIFEACRTWKEPLQHVLGTAFLVVVAYFMFPFMAQVDPGEEPLQSCTECAVVVEALTDAEAGPFLVCTENNIRLRTALRERIPEHNMVITRRDYLQRTGILEKDADYPEGSMKRKLRDTLFPKTEVPNLAMDVIDAVFVIKEKNFGNHWFKSTESLKEVVGNRTLERTLSHGPFTIEVYRRK